MLCVPALRLAVLQVAVFELALPVGRATALQPLSVVPSALKATLPVGALPVIVAVKVTFAPTADGLTELASSVVDDVAPPDTKPPMSQTAPWPTSNTAEGQIDPFINPREYRDPRSSPL